MSKKNRPPSPSSKASASITKAPTKAPAAPKAAEPEPVEVIEAEPQAPRIEEDHSGTYERIIYRTSVERDQKARVWIMMEEGDLTYEATISLERARQLHQQLTEAIDLDRQPMFKDDYKPQTPDDALPDPLVQEGVKAVTIAIHPQGMMRVTTRWGLDQAERLLRGVQAWIDKKKSGVKHFHHVERQKGIGPRPASALTPIDNAKMKKAPPA